MSQRKLDLVTHPELLPPDSHWTPTKEVEPHGNNRRFQCRCKCGQTAIHFLGQLRSGRTLQCETCNGKYHGMSGTPIYHLWQSMRIKLKKKQQKMPHEWQKFTDFQNELGPRRGRRFIARIDNRLPWRPGNITWSKTQDRFVKKSEAMFGITLSQAEWADRLQISRAAVHSIIRRYGSLQAAIEYRMEFHGASLCEVLENFAAYQPTRRHTLQKETNNTMLTLSIPTIPIVLFVCGLEDCGKSHLLSALGIESFDLSEIEPHDQNNEIETYFKATNKKIVAIEYQPSVPDEIHNEIEGLAVKYTEMGYQTWRLNHESAMGFCVRDQL